MQVWMMVIHRHEFHPVADRQEAADGFQYQERDDQSTE
jgi:hypothetical protein